MKDENGAYLESCSARKTRGHRSSKLRERSVGDLVWRAGNMCNLQDWLPDVNAGSCGAGTGSAWVMEDVLAVLLWGR